MRQEQITKEIDDLKLFLELYGEDQFHFKNNESPDFDLKLDDNTIGVEITRYRLSIKHSSIVLSVKSTMDSIKKNLTKKIRKEFSQKILIHYTLQKPIPRKILNHDKIQIETFLHEHLLSTEIQENLNSEQFRKEYKYTTKENEFISSISVTINKFLEESLVSDSDTYVFGILPEESIRNIVKTKNEKMNFTRNHENWLLIFLEQFENSDGVINETVLNYDMTEFNFDRIFLIEKRLEKIHEMRKCI